MMDVQSLASLVVGVIALAVVAAWAWRRERYSATLVAATAAAQAWREERDAEVSRRERIEAELTKAQEKITFLETRVGELEKRPDLKALEHLIELNEQRAAARTDKVLVALEAITAVLTVPDGSQGHPTDT